MRQDQYSLLKKQRKSSRGGSDRETDAKAGNIACESHPRRPREAGIRHAVVDAGTHHEPHPRRAQNRVPAALRLASHGTARLLVPAPLAQVERARRGRHPALEKDGVAETPKKGAEPGLTFCFWDESGY